MTVFVGFPFQKIPMISVFHGENTLSCHRLCFFFLPGNMLRQKLVWRDMADKRKVLASNACASGFWWNDEMTSPRLICKNQEERLSATWRQIFVWRAWSGSCSCRELPWWLDWDLLRHRLPSNTPGLFAAGWHVLGAHTHVFWEIGVDLGQKIGKKIGIWKVRVSSGCLFISNITSSGRSKTNSCTSFGHKQRTWLPCKWRTLQTSPGTPGQGK